MQLDELILQVLSRAQVLLIPNAQFEHGIQAPQQRVRPPSKADKNMQERDDERRQRQQGGCNEKHTHGDPPGDGEMGIRCP